MMGTDKCIGIFVYRPKRQYLSGKNNVISVKKFLSIGINCMTYSKQIIDFKKLVLVGFEYGFHFINWMEIEK